MTTKAEKTSLLSTFVAKAQQKLIKSKQHRTRELIVPSLVDDENAGKIKIRSLSIEEINECTEMNSKDDSDAGDKYACYLAIIEPSMKDVAKELQKQELISSPVEVTNIFEPFEIRQISTEIMKLSGMISDKRVQAVEELKN